MRPIGLNSYRAKVRELRPHCKPQTAAALRKPHLWRKRAATMRCVMADPKKLFIKTYGCQMNVYDSERMAEAMGADGYVSVDSAEGADMVLINTCHIREKASEKLYSDLGRLRKLKAENPAMKIGAQLAEVPMIHQGMSKDDAWALARQIVADVRLPDPDRIINAYPHQLSGGQQQRIVIAMHDFFRGGTERVSLTFARLWTDMGRDVTILCGSTDGGLRDQVDARVPVVSIAVPGAVFDKVLSNAQEAKARDAQLIGVAPECADAEVFDTLLPVPVVDELLSPLLTVIPMQLLSYHIAAHRGLDVDQPRNLAKSVTVE